MFLVSDITLQINNRFFEALDSLKRKRIVGGVNGFCKRYGISFGNLYMIKNQKQGAIKAEYLHFLVKDFNVSAEWLLTGNGNMFKQTSSKTELSQNQETLSLADS